MRKIWAIIISAACMFMSSCYHEDQPFQGEYDDVFIYYMMGYNDLNSYLKSDLEELCSGILPGKHREKAIVAFCHTPKSSNDYKSVNPPVLIRIAREEGKAVLDTVKVYDEIKISVTPECLNTVLGDIRELLPSKSYGILFSSHATGWVPEQYAGGSLPMSASSNAQHQTYPMTKSIGSFFNGGKHDIREMDIMEFAGAFPMKMDYIIFDACLMGGIEVAWELKDVCDHIVFSPTEILAQGMIYNTLSWNLLSDDKADLRTVCEEYIEFYRAESGQSCSATISLIDCRKLEALAEAFTDAVGTDGAKLRSINKRNVQRYFYDDKNWYYDLRDIVLNAGVSVSELEKFDKALEECVRYHAETETFFGVPLENCCGMSMYLIDYGRPNLNRYYKSLSWNKLIGLVE